MPVLLEATYVVSPSSREGTEKALSGQWLASLSSCFFGDTQIRTCILCFCLGKLHLSGIWVTEVGTADSLARTRNLNLGPCPTIPGPYLWGSQPIGFFFFFFSFCQENFYPMLWVFPKRIYTPERPQSCLEATFLPCRSRADPHSIGRR